MSRRWTAQLPEGFELRAHPTVEGAKLCVFDADKRSVVEVDPPDLTDDAIDARLERLLSDLDKYVAHQGAAARLNERLQQSSATVS